MTEERIRELRGFLDGATRRPWRFGLSEVVRTRVVIDGNGYLFAQVDDDGNGRLIAAAANALPEALDEIEKLRGLIRQVVDNHEIYCDPLLSQLLAALEGK